MNEPVITCPSCKNEIRLTDSLAAPIIEATRIAFEQQARAKDADFANREADLKTKLAAVEEERSTIDAEISARVDAERAKIAEAEAKKARLLVATDLNNKSKELTDLQDVLRERDAKLAEAQKTQTDLLRKQRSLDDAKRELDLTVEKRVQASIGAVREKAKKDAEDLLKLKVVEKEEQIASMQRQIEQLKQKAEQGSQQLQGEAQEIVLEELLRTSFPRDVIDAVPKGAFGGDVLHRVLSPVGQPSGIILWESKRTKAWSESWLPKLRDDQRAAKADVALLVSRVLPKGVDTFHLIDGVWVADPRFAVPLALVLREWLINLSTARQVQEGQITKTEMIYQYLTGPRFRHRIEAIVERFTEMQEDLNRERKAMTRLWAKREEQIRGVIESTAGMYGDLQGIAGKTLQEIEGLVVPLLDGPALVPRSDAA